MIHMKFKKTEKCDKEVKTAFYVLTSNLQETISRGNTLKMVNITRDKLGCKGENEYGECAPNFIIFDPEMRATRSEQRYEKRLNEEFPVLKPYTPTDKEYVRDEYYEKFEDEGRSLHIYAPWLEQKVYAKLDDFGSKENFRENTGMKMDTQFVVTLMLPEDY